MWTGQNVMSAYRLIAVYNNEKHNYANNNSFIPNNLNCGLELLIQWKLKQQKQQQKLPRYNNQAR